MNKTLLLILVVSVSFIVLGCGTTAFNFNEDLPASDVAVIYYAGVDIIEYNGMGLHWKAPMMGKLKLTIPGGDTLFVLNGTTGTANMGYTTYRSVPFTFNFEKGKEYTMYINQGQIGIHSGTKATMKTHIATFSMRDGQTLIMENGKRIR
ncbi:MAG: hypothetical protein FWD22_02880 [Treponema sp.]|nr:hypothetical protein [Treponema sp.]